MVLLAKSTGPPPELVSMPPPFTVVLTNEGIVDDDIAENGTSSPSIPIPPPWAGTLSIRHIVWMRLC
jgi:hypothetical protein